jgi:hypothetical protein
MKTAVNVIAALEDEKSRHLHINYLLPHPIQRPDSQQVLIIFLLETAQPIRVLFHHFHHQIPVRLGQLQHRRIILILVQK